MNTASRPYAASAVVGDYMALEPIVIGADATLSEAAALMAHHHLHGLPVVDRSGSLVGVLSQTDLNRASSTEYLWANWPGLVVRHLMTSPALTIHRSTPLVVAAQRMEREGIHRLVVVADGDDELPIGVLSMTDLIRALADATVPTSDVPPASAPESATDAPTETPTGSGTP